MSQKEIDRVDVLGRLQRKEMNGTKAAELLSLTKRQVRTLKKRFAAHGPAGLVHGNRGKPGHHRVPEKEKKKIADLLHKKYPDFGPTFAAEKLSEIHGIVHDPKTIRAIQIVEGLWNPRKNKSKSEHHSWRKRKDAFGEMLQYDGSYHDWFEGRGEANEQCLLTAIDDATGTVVQAALAAHEGVIPTCVFWREYILANGTPRAIYLDKFSTYKVNHKIASENPDVKTQFQRACNELGIQPIFANSPQAKGRVERLFDTLQDRLVKELRLADISTIEKANCFVRDVFLPKFNARFSVEPVSKANLHRPLTTGEKKSLASTLSRHTARTVQNDFTLAFDTTWYQLTKHQPCTVRKKDVVTVEEHTDGTIHICLRGKELHYETLSSRSKKVKSTQWVLPAVREPVKPAADHPWRSFHYGKSLT
ncbi:ISNCY family transposase, partial [Candidatus Uhrbacteria bacterium]|nr:ISNCY family transposase [Candidatus Uhrbacteria bacterium]